MFIIMMQHLLAFNKHCHCNVAFVLLAAEEEETMTTAKDSRVTFIKNMTFGGDSFRHL